MLIFKSSAKASLYLGAVSYSLRLKLSKLHIPHAATSFCADPPWSYKCETTVEHHWLFPDTPNPCQNHGRINDDHGSDRSRAAHSRVGLATSPKWPANAHGHMENWLKPLKPKVTR